MDTYLLIILDVLIFFVIFIIFKKIKKKIIKRLTKVCPQYQHSPKLHSFVGLCIASASIIFF